MSFGTRCEPSKEGFRTKTKKQRERKALPERMDAFDRIVQLCSVRDRSSRELRERLEHDGYAAQATTEALQRATDCGLVDDVRFVDALIRGKVAAGKGLYGIVQELTKHGIHPEGIEGWPDSYGLGEEDQLKRACEYLYKHPPKNKDIFSGAYRKLISRGYSLDIANKACRRWIDALNE